MSASLAEIIELLQRHYPPRLAYDWDAVGLVCGDPEESVDAALVAVDPDPSTVDEAITGGAQLLLTHHPLLLRGVHGVGADGPKGAMVQRMIRSGAALYCAHTNADRADPGVSDALAEAIGARVLGPLQPTTEEAELPEGLDWLTVHVPTSQAAALIEALGAVGAGSLGNYRHAAFLTEGTGQFLPLPGAHPSVGEVGQLHREAESRVEMVLHRRDRERVAQALREHHPYEQPSFAFHETAATCGGEGLGRIAELPQALTLDEFTAAVAAALPVSAAGVRAAGPADQPVRRIAVCGGAGDSLLGHAARAGVDAFVTGDLRHHPASEHIQAAGPALVDPGHFASEWPWCRQAAAILRRELGDRLEVSVSSRTTDPWRVHHVG